MTTSIVVAYQIIQTSLYIYASRNPDYLRGDDVTRTFAHGEISAGLVVCHTQGPGGLCGKTALAISQLSLIAPQIRLNPPVG